MGEVEGNNAEIQSINLETVVLLWVHTAGTAGSHALPCDRTTAARACLVDNQAASHKARSITGLYSPFRLFIIGDFHESETPWFSGGPVADQMNRIYIDAGLAKPILQFIFFSPKRHISNE